MKEHLRLARLYFALLAIFAIGRWSLAPLEVPYARGHHVFSVVILTLLSCIYYPAFARGLRGYGVADSLTLGAILGLSSQLVILVSTMLSYLFGIDSYWNHPAALGVPGLSVLGALQNRLLGLVANTLACTVVAALGWALGGLLPDADTQAG